MLAGVVDEDPVPIGIEQDRLTPKVRLVNRIADEVKTRLLEPGHGKVDVLDLEMDAYARNRRGVLGAVERQCRVALWGEEAGIFRVARDDLREAQASVEVSRRLHSLDRERDVVQAHGRRRYMLRLRGLRKDHVGQHAHPMPY